MGSIVESLAVFGGLEAEARATLDRGGREARLKAGQTVFAPGQACTAFLVVKAGSVKVSTATEGGRELRLYRVGPGETCVLTTVGLMARQDYDGEGVAESDCEATCAAWRKLACPSSGSSCCHSERLRARVTVR